VRCERVGPGPADVAGRDRGRRGCCVLVGTGPHAARPGTRGPGTAGPGPGQPAGDAPARPRAAGHRRRLTSVLLCAVPLLVVAVLGWQRRWISDDGLINVRVVDNVFAGHGPVFNVGERVEVGTSTAWLVLLGVGHALTPSIEVSRLAVWAGLLCTLLGLAGATAGAALLSRLLGDRGVVVPLGTVVLAALPPPRWRCRPPMRAAGGQSSDSHCCDEHGRPSARPRQSKPGPRLAEDAGTRTRTERPGTSARGGHHRLRGPARGPRRRDPRGPAPPRPCRTTRCPGPSGRAR